MSKSNKFSRIPKFSDSSIDESYTDDLNTYIDNLYEQIFDTSDIDNLEKFISD